MKKFFYLFTAITILFSCESNDDDSLPDGDPIIGEWQLVSEKENGVEESTSCSRRSRVTFSADGSFVYQGFYNETSTECESDSTSGTWMNDGNTNYTLDFGNGDTSTTKITFSNNNNTFSTTDVDDFDGQTFTYTETYNRI